MTKTIKTLSALADTGLLPDGVTHEIEEVCAQLPLGVTSDLLALMKADDPYDPIRLQFIPSEAEAVVTSEELRDPIGDSDHTPVKGVIHRYPDRVLLNPVTSCAAYCRFCFRRGRVGKGDGALSPDELEAALDYIAAHRGIREVILSGGDPLTLSDRKIAAIVSRLNAIAHVEILRIHTRLPIADPGRIEESLIQSLSGRLPVYLLLHCNHPNELGKAQRAALDRLSKGGVVLLSQSVLLRGVNDDADVLVKLMRAFLACRVVPTYIHHPDLAQGTGHFRPSLESGLALMQELRQRTSGICQPHYILEIPGAGGKIAVTSATATPNKDGTWRIQQPDGKAFVYREE